jgi:serine/threonine-protein kinase
MTAQRWRQIGDLFDAAIRLDPAGTEAWLDAACGGDDDLQTEVGRLLAQDERADRDGILTPLGRRARPWIGRRPGTPTPESIRRGSPGRSPPTGTRALTTPGAWRRLPGRAPAPQAPLRREVDPDR